MKDERVLACHISGPANACEFMRFKNRVPVFEEFAIANGSMKSGWQH